MVIALPELGLDWSVTGSEWCAMVIPLTRQRPGNRRMCDSKSAGDLSDAGFVVPDCASCPQVLVSQHAKASAGVDAGFDESLSDSLFERGVRASSRSALESGRRRGRPLAAETSQT